MLAEIRHREGVIIIRPTGRMIGAANVEDRPCLLYTSPSPRDRTRSRMPSSA